MRKTIISKAREYINTPFQHQGRLKNVGVDCAGLIICVCNDLSIDVYDVKGYNKIPDKGLFLKTVSNQLDKIDYKDIQIGDLMIFSFGTEPQHIAFISEVNKDYISIIHAFQKVTEHILDDLWKKRLSGCYKFKILKD